MSVVAGSTAPENGGAGSRLITVGDGNATPLMIGVTVTVSGAMTPAAGLPVNAGAAVAEEPVGNGALREPADNAEPRPAAKGTSTRSVPSVPPEVGWSVRDFVMLPV